MKKVNAMSFAHMMRTLMDGAVTQAELAERTGLHYVNVGSYLRELRAKRVVIVAGWAGEGTSMRALYSLARSSQTRDIKRPPALTGAERALRYRARAKRQARSAEARA